MQIVERLSSGPEVAWYRLGGDWQGKVQRYIVSTAPSREICNQPECLGVRYTSRLEEAMVLALRDAPFAASIRQHPEEKVCVVHFLRGGLNFGLRGALHTAFGFNRHSSAFLSSQRKRVGGRWLVQEDMYRKLDIPSDAILVMGDVVATGVTLENGLKVMVDHIQEIGSSLRGLVFFTIGCHKAEKILENLHARVSGLFPRFEFTALVYVEAKFRLVDSKTKLRIGIPGTDLLRGNTLLAPEFELSQYDDKAWPLERCCIYDAGSRAFDVPHYLEDVRGYWEQVLSYAKRGWTLSEAQAERWPLQRNLSEAAFMEMKKEQWVGVDPALVREVHRRMRLCCEEDPRQPSDSPDALIQMSRRRLKALELAGGTTERRT